MRRWSLVVWTRPRRAWIDHPPKQVCRVGNLLGRGVGHDAHAVLAVAKKHAVYEGSLTKHSKNSVLLRDVLKNGTMEGPWPHIWAFRWLLQCEHLEPVFLCRGCGTPSVARRVEGLEVFRHRGSTVGILTHH